MTKKDIFEILKNIDLDKLTESSFETLTLDCPIEHNKNFFSYINGASKGVIIPTEENFVIKIPFRGWERFNEETNESEIIDFCCAEHNYRAECWDYCETEAFLYEKAYEEGLGIFFAQTLYIGDINNYPIYIQPKCKAFNMSNYKSSAKERDEIYEFCSSHCHRCFDEDWLAAAKYYYGTELVLKLLSFIDKYYIDDLHRGNIGWLNNRPVLFDYSDFNE